MYDDEVYENDSSSYSIKYEEDILENDELRNCPNKDMSHISLVKIPVVIGECTVQFDIETKIKLPEPALEIKRIKKNVFLTECRLIARTNKVFLKGFVRKNIEYATIDCLTPKAICGDIKQVTVHIPFQCTAEVKCIRPAEFTANPPAMEINYFDEENLGIDMKDHDLISKEIFNEKVYCELESSSIYEADIIEDGRPIECHPIEHEFQTFIEKEVVCLTIRLLQNQHKCKACEEPEDICDL